MKKTFTYNVFKNSTTNLKNKNVLGKHVVYLMKEDSLRNHIIVIWTLNNCNNR